MLGVFLFSVVFSLPKFVAHVYPVLQIAFIRYFTGFATVSISSFVFGKSNLSPGNKQTKGSTNVLIHVIRAVLGVLTLLCIVYATGQLPLANVQMISLTNGIFVLFFSVIPLQERFNYITSIASIIGLLGVFVSLAPSLESGQHWLSSGAVVALFSSIFWGAEVVVLKFTANRDNANRILTIVNGAAVVMLLVHAIYCWKNMNIHHFFIIGAMGPLAILAQYCNIKGLRLADASFLVPIRYTSIISSTIIGVIFFGEWPGSTTIIGGSLIVFGGIMVSLSQSR